MPYASAPRIADWITSSPAAASQRRARACLADRQRATSALMKRGPTLRPLLTTKSSIPVAVRQVVVVGVDVGLDALRGGVGHRSHRLPDAVDGARRRAGGPPGAPRGTWRSNPCSWKKLAMPSERSGRSSSVFATSCHSSGMTGTCIDSKCRTRTLSLQRDQWSFTSIDAIAAVDHEVAHDFGLDSLHLEDTEIAGVRLAHAVADGPDRWPPMWPSAPSMMYAPSIVVVRSMSGGV